MFTANLILVILIKHYNCLGRPNAKGIKLKLIQFTWNVSFLLSTYFQVLPSQSVGVRASSN